VLTAAHVGDVTGFTFDGIFYDAVPASRVLLTQDGTPLDLAMIPLQSVPPLPAVTLPSAPVAVDELVWMIGNGRSRAVDPTCWTALWVEVACPAGTHRGYADVAPRAMRWGRNRVTDTGIDLPGAAGRMTRTFESLFDEVGETDEGQLVNGDSGGASFVKRGGTWELVGIHVAMGVLPDQPANTVVFGDTSIDADVYHYRSEIEAVLPPPQIPAVPWPVLGLGASALAASVRSRLTRRRPGAPASERQARLERL
jgi:hypothetical protein